LKYSAMGDLQIGTVGTVLISGALTLLTFMIVATTAFVKISVVMLIVRNALSIQSVPSNIIIYVFAFTITLFISAPVINDIFVKLGSMQLNLNSMDSYLRIMEIASDPVRNFLLRFTTESERAFFLTSTEKVWIGEQKLMATSHDLAILVPSFMVAELRRAFEIGFMIYLPFLVIDLVITTILMAMGMSMMSPATISTPIKLFLFVSIDGWSRLVSSLVMSYAR
jgi:type III secretion protein R